MLGRSPRPSPCVVGSGGCDESDSERQYMYSFSMEVRSMMSLCDARWAIVVVLSLHVGLAGCGEEDEAGRGIPDDPATMCNEANEDCAPGICGGEGATMLPGSNCISCHRSGSGAGEAGFEPGKWFALAGTVYEDGFGSAPAAGVTIRVTDAMGHVVTMSSNSAGNFFARRSMQSLVPPFQAEVEREGRVRRMGSMVMTGACNTCHKCGGAAGGKLYAP